MNSIKPLKTLAFLIIILFLQNSCKTIKNLPGSDARKFPADPAERVAKNLEEGRGFRVNQLFEKKGGVFDFASSNELWRASLDVLDFMPLSSVNYSGGIIITDWYTENNNPGDSIKITIRFLTNEIRSDAIKVKIFNRKCSANSLDCKFTETDGILVTELKKEILKKAAIYKNENEKEKKDNK